MQRLEREVLELPLDLVDAEPVRERRVDLERLAGLLDLLLAPEVLERAHVVQAVGELDQDDPHVVGHRDDHLPVVLGLRVLAALELDPRQLGDAFDEVRDLVAELGAHLVDARRRCPRRRRAGARPRSSRRRACSSAQIFAAPNGWWMNASPERRSWPSCARRRELEGASEQVAVGVRVVGRDLGDQLFEEILVPFWSFDEEPWTNCSSATFRHRFARKRVRQRIHRPHREVMPLCSDDTSSDAACSAVTRLLIVLTASHR